MAGLMHVSWQGWAALATFALQNGCAVLIIRWSKVMSPTPYSSQVAVLMQEVAVKLPVCTVLYALECGGVVAAACALKRDLWTRPIEWLQLAVPALLYTVQNTLLYVGFANVDASIGQITYQTKILWTAAFSILVLGKKLTANQWLALLVLALGVVAVQSANDPAKRTTHHGRPHHRNGAGGAGGGGAGGQNAILGVGALVCAALCTAFASVYFESMLKGSSRPSLWLRNIQLAAYSSLIATAGLLLLRDPLLAERGWLSGFGPSVWFSVVWQVTEPLQCPPIVSRPPETAARVHSAGWVQGMGLGHGYWSAIASDEADVALSIE